MFGFLFITLIVSISLIVFNFNSKNALNIISKKAEIESISFGTYFNNGSRSEHTVIISAPDKIEEFSVIARSNKLYRTITNLNVFNQAKGVSFFVNLKGKTGYFVVVNNKGIVSLDGKRSYRGTPKFYEELVKYFEVITNETIE